MENKEINGSVSVSKDVNIGGNAFVQGEAHFKGGLRVDGVLEAECIKGLKNNFTNKFLGYFYGIGDALREIKQPETGMFFVNGETNSVWMWDALTRMWIDTNRVDSGMKGMLNDDEGNSPSDFVPSPQSGINESYFYVAECDDCDLNPEAKPKNITFTYFKNGNSSVSVTVRKTSIVSLFWNGTYWETSVVPIRVNWNLLYPRMFYGTVKARYVEGKLRLFNSWVSATENEEFMTNCFGGDLGRVWRVQGDQGGILISGWWNLVLITPKSHFVFRYSDEDGNEIPTTGPSTGGYWRNVTEYNHITQDERKEWNKITTAVADIANIKPNVLNGKMYAYLEDGKYKLYSKYETEGEKIEFTSNSMGGAVGNVWRVSGNQGGILISGWSGLLLISPTSIIKFKHNGDTQGWEEDNNTSLVQLGTSINEVKTDLDSYKYDLGYRKLNVNVISGQSPNMFSLEPYRGKEVCVKVTGDFSSFGYRDPSTTIEYTTLANSDKNGEWVTFIPSESAGDFFVYKRSSIADSYVDIDFRANLAKDVVKVDEIDVIDAKIGYENITKIVTSPNSSSFYDITKYRGSTIAVKVTGVFSSFGYFKPTVDNPNAYKPLGEEPDKYVTFEVPEDATSLYVYNNTGANEEVTMHVRANASFEIAESNALATQAKEEVTAIDAKIGFAEYKDISYKSVKRVFSLVPYRGNAVAVKVTGYFQNFGYYYGTEGKYNSVRNKDNYDGGFYSFVVEEDATDFYVYTDNGGSTVNIEFRANLAALIGNTEVPTKGCVFMSLGDSITTESYYIKPLREILQPSKYYNLAVAGAWWADKPNTSYDGNPQFNGADNNVNNVLGNQVQKIIDNPDDYAEAPDIIIIAAGTNDSDSLGVSNNTSITGIRSAIDIAYQDRNGVIPISEPTFDENDTYKEFRRTIAGAMRYCVTKLQQLFPRAKIYILTPIQGCFSSRDYYFNIATKQEYISESAKHLGVPVIHVGEECGINSDFEYGGAMWTAPTGSHERSGRDLIDGLHPNANGSKKMADYIALNIINSYKSIGKTYSVVGSSLSINGEVDGETLKL